MTNITALAISRQYEGCRLSAWLDTVADPPVWTIGRGHTGPDVHEGLVWTQAQADADQVARLDRTEVQVRRLLTRDIPSGKLGALISLADNGGIGIEINSRLIAAVNRGDWCAAAKEFIDDDHVKGREVEGLLTRRLYEAFIFMQSR